MPELKTRIQLKYDTLTNWNASSFKLKAGELAIVTLGPTKDGTVAGVANQHPILFKVGTGNHTFSELPYASALAADVYSWAKAEDVVLSGKTIQFKTGENVIKSIALNYVTEDEATALINNALKDYSTTTEMNTAIGVEKARAEAAEEALANRVTTLETSIGNDGSGLIKDVADLKAAVGEGGSVADAIDNAIAGLDSSASQTAGDDGLALNVTLVDGKVTTISGSIAAETYDEYGAAAAVLGTAEDTATANTVYGAKAAAADALKAAQDAQKDFDAFMTGVDDTDEVINTLTEIQEFMTSETGAFVELSGRVTNLENGTTPAKKAEHAATASGLDATGVAQVKGITVDNATKAATAEVANSLSESAEAEVKAIKVDNATNADDSAKLCGVEAANYLLKSEAPGYNDILTKTNAETLYQPKGEYATAAQGAKADTALQSVSVGEGLKVSEKANNSQTIEIDESVVFVFDCGSATVNID